MPIGTSGWRWQEPMVAAPSAGRVREPHILVGGGTAAVSDATRDDAISATPYGFH